MNTEKATVNDNLIIMSGVAKVTGSILIGPNLLLFSVERDKVHDSCSMRKKVNGV